MNGELPRRYGDSYFENIFSRKRSLGMHLIFGIFLMFAMIISMFAIIMLTMARVKHLEREVVNMKETLDNLNVIDNDLINAVIGFEYEDDSDDDTDDDSETFYDDNPVINNNEYFDYGNFDPMNETANRTENEDYQSPINLTKDRLESLRSKRDVIAATQDGVVINSESYAEKKAKNNTSQQSNIKGERVSAFPAKPSSLGSHWPVYSHSYHTTPSHKEEHRRSTKAPRVYTRQSRVMHHDDKSKALRRIVKKSALKSGDMYQDSNEDITTSSPDFTIIRDNAFPRRRYRQRNSNLETLDEGHHRTGRIKPLPAAHYNGDTSKYVVGQHTNYLGNGHIRHHQRTFVDWKSSDWVQSLGMDSHFTLNDGYLTIKESGLYLIYSQIYYLDEHDTTGYRVFKNNDMVLQCTLTIHSVERRLKGNTCFTAGVEHFSEGDRLSLADITEGRLSLFEPGKSFFGLIKLGDVRIK